MPVAPERKPAGWPLLAIAGLVVLLAGFLYVRWSKRAGGPPLVVKEAPAPRPLPPEPVSAPVPAPDPMPPPPPVPAPDYEKLVAEARDHLAAARWDEALRSLEAARKVRPEAPELGLIADEVAVGRRKEGEAVAEAKRIEERRIRQRAAFAELKEGVEKSSSKDLWDAAWTALEGHLKEWPAAAQDEEYSRLRKKVAEYRGEADKLYAKSLAEARKLFDEGRYAQAIRAADTGVTYYPERMPEVRAFQEQARQLHFQQSMVRIPSTLCWIGSTDQPDEGPVRQVRLPPFLIDKYEVTNEDYLAFVAATGHAAPPTWRGRKPPPGRDRHPVVTVSYTDAQAYAAWAGKRLPTAEEWEVAARGPDRREYPWGNAFLEKDGVFAANCLEFWQVNKTQNPGTTPVDAFDAAGGESPFGVQGLAGNVWEWTSSPAPTPEGATEPGLMILKGGSFMTPRRALRAANLYAEDPRLAHFDVGFRCVRDLP
jgi:formylglycine-generating enzyme required for sulfatase activity